MMSNRILTIVTLVAVSLHALLGCCWHHGHHSESTTAAVQPTTCCYHGHSHSDDSKRQQSSSEDSCDHAACTFYSPDNTDLDLSARTTVSWLPAPDDLLSVLSSVQNATVHSPFREHQLAGITEPLHALVQVWLI